MEHSASAPAVGSAAGGKQRVKYNIKQFKGVIDDVSLVKSVVEKERAEALEQAAHIEKLFNERDAEAHLIQKELSVQLRCAGRSYQQILGANRQLSEELRAEAEKRAAEVSILEQQVQELKSALEKSVKPWKEEVSKRDLKIIKLQEAAVDKDKELRDSLLELPREREKLTKEIDILRQARDETVLEYSNLKGELDAAVAAAAAEKEEIKRVARKDVVELQLKMEAMERDAIEQKRQDEKTIDSLKLTVEGLNNTIEEHAIEHQRYDKKIELKEEGFDYMAKDFKVKVDQNHDLNAQTRANYEKIIEKMDQQLQEAERVCRQKIKPWEELSERHELQIRNLKDKLAEASEEQKELRQREAELTEELEKTKKTAAGAIEDAQIENYKLSRKMEKIIQEHEESAPLKNLVILEMKLNEVISQTQLLLKKRDVELQEKTEIINNLQKAVRAAKLKEREFEDLWNDRVQQKEEGYGNVVAQLKFAEGQIEQERGRTTKALQVVRKREKSIDRLKAEHAEELQHRVAEREAAMKELVEENERWAEVVDKLEAEREATERKWEDILQDRIKRQADREADLHIEMLHRDEVVAEMEENIKVNRAHFDKQRLSWEEKERELQVMIRARDRSITGLKNEIEFIHESWELKYNRLMELFEKLQQKFEAGIGHQGIMETVRRAAALKEENEELNTQIKQLKEGLKKQKKQIRDLQVDVDMVTKETADILADKDKAMSELVGENVNLSSKLQASIDEREAMIREMKSEMVQQGESFQARMEQLEQLAEAMRFTDRQMLIDKIDVWKRAYERVAISRDDQEEEFKETIDVKDKQLGKIAEEYKEILLDIDRVKAKAVEDLEALEKEWKEHEKSWKADKGKLLQEIQALKGQMEKDSKKQAVTQDLISQVKAADSTELDNLKAKVERQRVKKKALKAGVQELINENTDWRKKCDELEEQLTASKQDLDKHTKWRDDRYEAMMKEHEALKKVLESEMSTAQDTCKEVEEQVRLFPSPFEIELQELKDRYAQTQAGMLQMSLENTRLQEKLKDQQEAAQKEVDDLEANLKLAHYLLSEVGSVGDLKKITPSRPNTGVAGSVGKAT